MNQEIIPPSKPKMLTAVEAELKEHAGAVRLLGRRMIGDAIEIGRHLHIASDLCKKEDVGWEEWLKTSLGLSKTQAWAFINLHKLSLETGSDFERINLPVSGLMLLAQPATSAEARAAVLNKAATEPMSYATVKREIAKVHAAELAEHEQKIRAEYEDYVDQEELKRRIDEVLAPVEAKLDIAWEALAKKDDRTKAAREKKATAADIVLLNDSIRRLANCLTVSPQEYRDAGYDNDQHADRAREWLTKYLDLVEQGDVPIKREPRRTRRVKQPDRRRRAKK